MLFVSINFSLEKTFVRFVMSCNFRANLDPRALLLTEGEKSSGEPCNKVSSHWFS